jgi:hypothetical protein
MSIEQIIGILGQVATWVTVILVFFTLREMEKQRKASQKPELIIPNVSVFGYTDNKDIFIASNWSNKEIKSDGFVIEKYPQFILYNIGAGAAKEINIKWDFDLTNTVKSIQDYCYRNSIPVVVSIQKDMLQIQIKERGSYMIIKAFLNAELAYLCLLQLRLKGSNQHYPLHS